MLGLGNSVGTPPAGVEGEVLVVRSFQELDAAAPASRARSSSSTSPFTNYGETVQYRSAGPVTRGRARRGCRRWSARSVRPDCARPTPARSATSTVSRRSRPPRSRIEDAERLQRMQDRGTPARVRLKMEAQFLPDADSGNVVGEIRGRELPDEVVVIGGHFDSWDVGTGSTDDGGGCIVTWEALRLMKKLNLRPRRTVRVVLWTNEENGLRGGQAYRERYRDQLANHVLMLESDGGVFRPTGFGFTGSDAARATRDGDRDAAARASRPTASAPRGGGADIGPSVEAGRIPVDVARRGRQLLPDPPHAGRHDRQDRSDGHGAGGRGDRRDDLRDRGHAGETALTD